MTGRTQPAATIKAFVSLLERAESMLDRLEPVDAPYFNERRKLRTHIREALGLSTSDKGQTE